MSRSRLVLSLAAALVGLGLATGLGVLVLAPARAAVGPLRAEALALPADARFLVGLDARRLVASPLYAHFSKGPGGMRPDVFKTLEDRTGISPERDVREVVIAGGLGGGKGAVAILVGDFDRAQIGRALEAGKKATAKKTGGATVYVFDEGQGRSTALAFLEKDSSIVMGATPAVESTVENRARGRAALKENAVLMDLLAAVKPGSTFWMVGDQSLLADMPTSVSGGGASGGSSASLTLPKLNSLTVTGDLDPLLSVEVVGGAADAPAAANIADVVRGFVALATLQAAQKPELKALQTALTVTTEANRVKLSGRFPHELVEALAKPKASPATVPPATLAPAP